jgi:predicted esterase
MIGMKRIQFPAGAILFVMPILLFFAPHEGAAQTQERIVHLSDPPRVLVPAVDFLADTPVIDGVLDSFLESLPPRGFSEVDRDDAADPVIPVSYRLAYGTDFFYVYVETEGDHFAFRDRAYQNGDGFHMLLCLPKAGDVATDEFYVIACSAVNDPSQEWCRRIFWYYNVDNIFIPTSPETKLEFRAHDGKLSFELLLPWKDVHPYHPWISKGIGFNMRFVKALDENHRNEYIVVPDELGAENRNRLYAHLEFDKPALASGAQSYFLPSKNHLAAGETIAGTTVTLAAGPYDEDIRVRIKTGEGTTVGYSIGQYACETGLTTYEFKLDTAERIPGGYKLEWYSIKNNSRGESGLSILPAIDVAGMKERLSAAAGGIAAGSVTTIEFLLQEMEDELAKIRSYETCAVQRTALFKILGSIERAELGIDDVANRRGYHRRAYRSQLDGTLQPYCVKIPDDLDVTSKYSLIVFLHGSASDETDIVGFDQVIPEGYIALGPRGRGPSNGFHADNAQVDIAEAIDDVVANYPIDTKKIVLAGFSMGGYGVYRTFYETADKFRALVVLSGIPYQRGRDFEDPAPDFRDETLLKRFAGVPMFIFHGMQDRNCPYDLTASLVENLRSAGAHVQFETDSECGHQQPGPATYEKYYEWLRNLW